MPETTFKTIKTPDGIILHVYQDGAGANYKPHSMDGPAIKYPKSMKKQDEYYIYGLKYTKPQWEEIKDSTKVTYMPIDPNLE